MHLLGEHFDVTLLSVIFSFFRWVLPLHSSGVYDAFRIYIFLLQLNIQKKKKKMMLIFSELGRASWPGSSRRGRPGSHLQEARGGKCPATCNAVGEMPWGGGKDGGFHSNGDYLHRARSRPLPRSLQTILIIENKGAAPWTSTCTASPDQTRAQHSHADSD